MTREEIIDGLKFTVDMFLFDSSTGKKYTEPRNDMDKTTIDACRGAIELLEQEPCEDAIGREDMLDAIGHGTTYTSEELQRIIKGLPPVNPQAKTGHWIYDYVAADGHRVYHCSECGCYLKPKHSEPLNSFKWCSLCGAKMVEPQKSEERSGEEV